MRRSWAFHLFLLLAIIPAVLLALGVGQVPLSWPQVVSGLIDGNGDSLEAVIVREIRLPRVLLAILAGMALGMSGAALQGFLRNPLADPSLLGVTNGAALGAVLAIYGGFIAINSYILPVSAMAGAFIAVGLACVLARLRDSPYALILAGIAVSSLLGAAVALALNLAPNPFAAMEVIFWLMGSLEGRSMPDVWLILPIVMVGMALIFSCRRGLDALTLGEQTATSLGFSLSAIQLSLVMGIALSVGAVTAVTGSIGFIGLVVPHIMRFWYGEAPGRLLAVSALGGAIMVLLADTAVRVIPTSGMELRLSVVTALVGAPFFMSLLFQKRKSFL
jgi:iron complex transport system permease protein